jgi:hypothetical protein
MLRVYHRIDHADAILRDGFLDGHGHYLTDQVWRGVWVSANWPLDANDGAEGDVVLELEIPESLFVEYEWVEAGKTCREALIPAATLNEYTGTLRVLPETEEVALSLASYGA